MGRYGGAAAAQWAGFRLHVDPFVSGGFETDVDLSAQASVPLSVGLEARLIQSEGESAVVVGPAVACRRFQLTLEEGNLDLLGVRTDAFVGKRQLAPLLAMESLTRWFRLVDRQPAEEFVLDADYWIGLRLEPVSVVAGTNGYRLFGNIESELSMGKPEMTSLGASGRDALEKVWREEVQSECPEELGIVVLFAGEDFGPNNDVVKAMKVLAPAVELGTKTLGISWKNLVRVVENPEDVGPVAMDTLEELTRANVEVLEDTAEAAGRILEDIAEEAEEVLEDAGDEIGEVLEDAGDVLEDLGQGTEKLIKSVIRW